MLEGLNDAAWDRFEHAYGKANDVPGLLRQLQDPAAKVRGSALRKLGAAVCHQGTRYPAAPNVIPFLIELCASPEVRGRGALLCFWGELITGDFSIRARPWWGDGERVLHGDEPVEADPAEPQVVVLHRIYQESLAGYDLLLPLLGSRETELRSGAAWVLACLRTRAQTSIPALRGRLAVERTDAVRAALAFALGELGAVEPLLQLAGAREYSAAGCMATCELTRLQPSGALLEPLLKYIARSVPGYEAIPGAGGKSTGDATFSLSYLPVELLGQAVPAICEQLVNVRSFETIPLVEALFASAFEPRSEPLEALDDLQREVLGRMVRTQELWHIGNLYEVFREYGLPRDREKCAALVGAEVRPDPAYEALRAAVSLAEIGFLDRAREGIDRALALDPGIFERVPAPEEHWLLCAKAFAETDPARAREAYQRAVLLDPEVARGVKAAWKLPELIRAVG